ncbi:hypothetical protein [Rhizobium sp. LjRoot254]|uniref:hypothetical protein n=1 Tax=Rhizobium sp. LjRoot254 TaxID=3342297 RepID=UPI003ECDFC92
MSINSPRYPGSYSQRATDCELAIERDFLREVVDAHTPFIDLDAILIAIADDALKAGWSEDELTEAAIVLAKRHKMNNGDKCPK